MSLDRAVDAYLCPSDGWQYVAEVSVVRQPRRCEDGAGFTAALEELRPNQIATDDPRGRPQPTSHPPLPGCRFPPSTSRFLLPACRPSSYTHERDKQTAEHRARPDGNPAWGTPAVLTSLTVYRLSFLPYPLTLTVPPPPRFIG
jgi:hypothetical protein